MGGRSRAAATAVAACVLASISTFTYHVLPVHATVPAPGSISTYAGSAGIGPATNVPQEPGGVAFWGSGGAGTLYVADFGAFMVRALDLTTGTETVYAGTGDPGENGDGGPATAAAIGNVQQITLDASGNLYLAAVDRIRRVDAVTHVITTVAGGGSGPLGDGGPATSATLYASSVSFDPDGNMIIADSGHNRIRSVSKVAPHIITTLAGNGLQGFAGDGGLATAAELNEAEYAVKDASHALWIADTFNNRVRKVDPAGNITTVAGNGGYSTLCISGGALEDLQWPDGLWFDQSGLLYVTSVRCVQRLGGGLLTTVAGCTSCSDPADNHPPLDTYLGLSASAGDPSTGDLFLADSNGRRVREFVPGDSTLHTLAGNGAKCATTLSGQATSAYLCRPEGMAFDAAGDLFIADQDANQVDEVAADGTVSIVAGNGTFGFSGDNGPATAAQLWAPTSVAVDGAGTLYIGDWVNGRIRKVVGGTITTLTTLNYPLAMALDPSGNLIVATGDQQRILRVSTSNGLAGPVAGTGVAGFSGDGGLATAAQVSYPYGVAVDAAGDIYVNDTGNERLRKIDPSGVITTVANLASVSQFTGGGGVAVGPSGQVVVAGAYNPSVLLVSRSGTVRTIAGGTTAGFAGDGGPAGTALLSYPNSAAFDAAGDLFVSDSANHRVRRIQTYGATSAPTSVKASAGFASAHVTWTAPLNSTPLAVTDYIVKAYNGVVAGPSVVVSGSPAPTAATFSGLAAGTQYTFTVTASNGWMPSPESPPSNAITVLNHPRPGAIAPWAGTPGSGPALGVAQAPYAIGINGVDVYEGDIGTGVVRDINTRTAQESALAGNGALGYSGDHGAAVNAMVSGSTAIAVCGGNTYFDDTLNYVIRKIDASGVISVFAGTGVAGYSGDGGPATAARIGRVLGLACRTGGGLYVSDSDSGALRIIDGAGRISSWWTGFSFPTGVTELGANDVVALSDSGADNAVWYLSDAQYALIAGTPGKTGDSPGQNGGPADGSLLDDPRGLAYNSGSGLYIADAGNSRIKEVLGGDIYDAAGTGVAGFTGDGISFQVELNYPTDIQWLSNGSSLVVADTLNFRVRILNLAGGPSLSTIAGNGTPSRSGDGGSSLDAQVGSPYAVAVDAAGNQYVADELDNVIRKIDVNGVITTFAGDGVAGYSGDAGPAGSAELSDPRGVAVGPDGSVYISDTGNQVIRRVNPGGTITTFAGSHVAGFFGDGGPAMSARLNSPAAVAVAPNGDVYIADAANNRVRMVDHTSQNISTVAGTGVGSFNGDGPVSSAQLHTPLGLAVDGAGHLYIADTGNNRVREVLGGVLTTVAGNGVSGVMGDGGHATSAEISFPFGLAFDPAGNLYIADTNNSRIRRVDTTTHVISTVVGACGRGYGGDWGPAYDARVNFPFGLAIDGGGTMYVADTVNNRVRTVYGQGTARTASCQSAGAPAPGSRTALHLPALHVEQAAAAPLRTAVSSLTGPITVRPAPKAPVRASSSAPPRAAAPPAHAPQPGSHVAAPATRSNAPAVHGRSQVPAAARVAATTAPPGGVSVPPPSLALVALVVPLLAGVAAIRRWRRRQPR